MSDEDNLKRAIEVIKAGDKKKGGEILFEIINKQPKNELAWAWLSVCVRDDKQKKYCIEKVLEINPDNLKAKQALERLNRIDEPPLDEITKSPSISKNSQIESQDKDSKPKAQKHLETNSNAYKIIVGGLLLIIIISGIFIYGEFLGSNKNILPIISLFSTRIPSATSTPTIDWSNVDLSKFLLEKTDLSFGGLYQPNNWISCGVDSAAPIPGVREKSIVYGLNGCQQGDISNIILFEHIYVELNNREATRFLTGQEQLILDGNKVVGVPTNTSSIQDGNGNIITIIEFVIYPVTVHAIFFTYDRIAFFIEIDTGKTLISQDFKEIESNAINKIQ